MFSSYFKTRYRIIEELYKINVQFPSRSMDRAQLREAIGVSEEELELNVRYLEQKGLIRGRWTGGSPQHFLAKITAGGMDVYENQREFLPYYPFLKINFNIQEIRGSVVGPITQGEGATVFNLQQITDSFQSVRDIITSKDIPESEKEESRERLKELEEELEKEKPDSNIIRRSWDWFNMNASWLVPWITKLLIEASTHHRDILVAVGLE